jgi:CubicO group peptidase (beta-lactamase class C family)
MKNILLPSTKFPATILMIIILTGCSQSPAETISPAAVTPTAAQGEYWPTDGWRTSTPEEQGMDPSKLTQMMERAGDQKLSLDSLLVIRNGFIVSETYFNSYQADLQHIQYSVTKSFLSTLVGIAVDRGMLTIDSRVLEYFPGKSFKNPDERKTRMTVEDLLTMRSGLEWQDADPVFNAMYGSSDWVKFMLDRPMLQSPGTLFNYCSGCTHLLSAILQEAAGKNANDFAEEVLFHPLGITNYWWESDPQGISIGGWGLHLTPRDMAKLGYLYLHSGEWNGQQVVSEEWVQTATSKHTSTGGTLGYGYQWWTYPSWNAYAALGRGGQTIFVVPEAELIVVTTAASVDHDDIFRLIEEYIFPAIQA